MPACKCIGCHTWLDREAVTAIPSPFGAGHVYLCATCLAKRDRADEAASRYPPTCERRTHMSAFNERVAREDEADRLRAVLKAEAEKSDVDIRAAFWHAATGLLEWQDPPLVSPREYRRLELLPTPRVTWQPPAGDDVEPYDIDADWEERA